MIESLDIIILSYLNGFIGHSRAIDIVVYACASFLPLLLGWVFILAIAYAHHRNTRRAPHRGDIFTRPGRALIAGIVALGAGNVAAVFLQDLIMRPRPYVSLSIPHLFLVDNWSFPSGHATTVFALAAAAYAFDRRVGAVLLLGGFVAGLGRIAAGVHYPFDILAGAAIGAAIGFIVSAFLKRAAAVEGMH